MKLDFFTLYVIILLNSIMFVWAGFVFANRTIPGARFWLATCLLTTAGGLLLSFEASEHAYLLTIAGNASVVLGFCMMWSGIRSFYGIPVAWRTIMPIVVFSIVVPIFAGDSRASQNIAYACAQMVPMALAICALAEKGRLSLGAIVAMSAIGVAMAGQGTEAILNVMRLTGALTAQGYYDVGAYLLVAVIFGASLFPLDGC